MHQHSQLIVAVEENQPGNLINSRLPLTDIILCATKKEKALPTKMWYSIDCKMHPNLRNGKIFKNGLFGIEEYNELG